MVRTAAAGKSVEFLEEEDDEEGEQPVPNVRSIPRVMQAIKEFFIGL
ncbi:hypothetical protein EVA_01038 [gut metagenome]|uniref:Uncharacterized protein n=1 Tax=gut metagenome TaxID=749906 RepID=J9H871_9ZZZZ